MKHAIIKEQLPAYLKADKKQKGAILCNVMSVTKMPRKSLIRALARERKRSKWKAPPKFGRPKYYTRETEAALAWLWEQYDYPCAERLHDEIPEAIRIFIRDKMWNYSEEATEQLWNMSLGAMKQRTTVMAKKKGLLRGQSTTKSSELLKSVPVFFGSWDKKAAGNGQIDTVVHSGPKLMGTMAYTVNYVDVATYWQEPVAQLNKSSRATLASMETIKDRLPFPWLGVHPDSGSEFINELALPWFEDNGIESSRSRPNKKNDNCFVEQRNLVVVRKYVGYERYDCKEAVEAMNGLYATLRLYINFFQPTFKLIEKRKVVTKDDGQKQVQKSYRRVYDGVKTPYKRVLDRNDIDKSVKDKLTEQYESLNPKVLRDKIHILTSKLERTQRELGYHY
ncbi:hypothetical protein M1512_01440 [Patescibacteria group bacterium]|nr:hypothetical protein [Patescibacteria group bacterium]